MSYLEKALEELNIGSHSKASTYALISIAESLDALVKAGQPKPKIPEKITSQGPTSDYVKYYGSDW